MSTDKNNKLRITNVKTNINLDITSREKNRTRNREKKLIEGKKTYRVRRIVVEMYHEGSRHQLLDSYVYLTLYFLSTTLTRITLYNSKVS